MSQTTSRSSSAPDSEARAAALAELLRPPERPSPVERLRTRTTTAGPVVPPWVRGVGVAVAAAIALGAWMVLRRPPDATTALPRVGTQAEGSASSQPSTTTGAGTATTAVGHETKAGASGAAASEVVVHVAGAVLHPGVVTLPAGGRAVDAVTAAGGLAPGADPDRVNLAAPLVDGERLVIPLLGQPAPAELAPDVPGSGGAGGTAGTAGGTSGPVDLNTASAEQLDALPGVGPSTAAAIISHRDENGPFTSVDGLLDVRGIGDAKLDALRDLVTVGG